MPLLCVVLGFVYQAIGVKPMFAVEFSTGLPRYMGSLSSAAFTSALAMCGLFSAVQMMLHTKRSYALLAIINLVVLLAAGGRATLVVALSLSVISIMNYRGISFRTKAGLMLSGVLAGALVASVFWQNISARLAASGDSGRSLMWDYLRTVIAQYPDTGIGFGHQFFATPREIIIMFSSASAHNDYLRLAPNSGRSRCTFSMRF